jgi:diacylglycerol kinase family enzyme
MNIAAVINVAPGRAALSRATETQNLLLEYLGPRLGSIRLAAPHLLKQACRGALAERPDVLVVAGGARAVRRAGQLAYTHRLPIIFLPSRRPPPWARQLWGSLSLEEMVAALAEERLIPLHIPVGLAGGEIFFGNATCGFLPQFRRLRSDLVETESLSASARVLSTAARASSLAFGRKIRIWCHGAPRMASAVLIDVQRQPPDGAVRRFGAFACAAWRQSSARLAGAKLRAALAGDWQSAHEPDRFYCSKLTLQSGAKTWLLLDGEVIAFNGAVELRYIPRAVQTFAFAAENLRPNTPPRDSFRPAPYRIREPRAGLPRSTPGRRQQTDSRDWMPARVKEV